MGGPADVTGLPDARSRIGFFDCEIVCKDQPLETRLQFALNFYLSDTRPVCTSIFGMRIGRISTLGILTSSSVVAFRDLNSDLRNEARFATSRQASEVIAPEAPHSHEDFLSVCPNSSSEGERRMKDTDHPIRHPLRHPRIFGRARRRRDCTWRNDQFGRVQNTGLGWSDPTFVHGSVPKVLRGVAPAQLRDDCAECFVR